MARHTEQKQAIQQALMDSKRPLRPDEVLALAQSEVPRLGIATVYRNLKRMCADGILRAVQLPGELTTMYELADLHHHHHFHCGSCERVFDVDVCPGDFAGLVPQGFVVKEHELVLYGSCQECAA